MQGMTPGRTALAVVLVAAMVGIYLLVHFHVLSGCGPHQAVSTVLCHR
jgi:hypothetical protein